MEVSIDEDSTCTCHNTEICTNISNSNLIQLLKSIGDDTIILLMHCPKLNSINLVFSDIVQRFTSWINKASIVSNSNVLNLLNEIEDSMTSIIIFFQ